MRGTLLDRVPAAADDPAATGTLVGADGGIDRWCRPGRRGFHDQEPNRAHGAVLRAPTGSTLVQLDGLRTAAELLAGTAVTLFELTGGRLTHFERWCPTSTPPTSPGPAADAVDHDADAPAVGPDPPPGPTPST